MWHACSYKTQVFQLLFWKFNIVSYILRYDTIIFVVYLCRVQGSFTMQWAHNNCFIVCARTRLRLFTPTSIYLLKMKARLHLHNQLVLGQISKIHVYLWHPKSPTFTLLSIRLTRGAACIIFIYMSICSFLR